jgi:hypothetical protein
MYIFDPWNQVFERTENFAWQNILARLPRTLLLHLYIHLSTDVSQLMSFIFSLQLHDGHLRKEFIMKPCSMKYIIKSLQGNTIVINSILCQLSGPSSNVTLTPGLNRVSFFSKQFNWFLCLRNISELKFILEKLN